MTASSRRAGIVSVNGVDLYREIRGDGPPLLFIQGALGDGGTFDRVAEILADEFAVTTYDRRANSRSPRPSDYVRMLISDQADDAAGVIATGTQPAVVFATSGGAVIGLELLARHPELVHAALLHEPALLALLGGTPYEGVAARFRDAIRAAATQQGGANTIAEMFLREVAGGAVWEELDHDLRRRLQGNGRLFAAIEAAAFAGYRPDEGRLAAISTPVVVLAGTESPPFRRYLCEWLVTRFQWQFETLTGGHTPYLDRPKETANTLRKLLRNLWRARTP